MATGWTLDHVLSYDVVTFNALMARMVRIRYDDLTERTWVNVATTNAGFSGKTKGIEKLTNAWAGNTSRDPAEAAKRTGRDANAFLRDFKLLGGGRI